MFADVSYDDVSSCRRTFTVELPYLLIDFHLAWLVRFLLVFEFFREARQLGSTKNVGSVVKSINRIKDVHCNCNGSKVSIICTKVACVSPSILFKDYTVLVKK